MFIWRNNEVHYINQTKSLFNILNTTLLASSRQTYWRHVGTCLRTRGSTGWERCSLTCLSAVSSPVRDWTHPSIIDRIYNYRNKHACSRLERAILRYLLSSILRLATYTSSVPILNERAITNVMGTPTWVMIKIQPSILESITGFSD